VLLNPSWAVPRALGLIFMFCGEGVGSSSHVLRSWTIFDDIEGIVPVFLFVPLGPVFHGSDGVGSRFDVLRSRNRF
jgi:hypothetical protein